MAGSSLLWLSAALGFGVSAVSGTTTYAPSSAACPSGVELFRDASGLNPQEAAWVKGRKAVVYDSFAEYLKRLGMKDFDLDKYLCAIKEKDYENTPVLAWAISGGGVASSYTGTGGQWALDERNPAAVKQRTGGLLQSMTYYTGQSGGSWPALAFPFEGFPTVDDILNIWKPWVDVYDNTTLQAQVFSLVGEKYAAGYNVSVGDYLGLLETTRYVPDDILGLYSDLVDSAEFKNYSIPFPFVAVGEVVPSDPQYFNRSVPASNGSATQYEVTPFEWGSWGGEGKPKGFQATKYMGTAMNNGKAVGGNCTTEYDRVALMIGASCNAPNFWDLLYLTNQTIGAFPKRSLSDDEIQAGLAKRSGSQANLTQQYDEDVAIYQAFAEYMGLDMESIVYVPWPNPYKGMSDQPSYYEETELLTLVDATELGTALPVQGLVQPERKTDFMMLWDGDEDTTLNWNNGTNLRNAYLQSEMEGLPFPKIPSIATMIHRGYNLHPTLFGCDSSLAVNTDAGPAPVVAYFSNAPYSAYTNYSWTQEVESREQMYQIFGNSFNLVTQGNGTLAKDWVTCLGCAAIERSRERVGIDRSSECESCFKEYCWDGTEDDVAAAVTDPALILPPHTDFKDWIAAGNPY